MTTPMTINMKLLSDKSSDLVDPTMYRQLDWILDVPG
jgi:hypothetical protein